MMFYYLRSTTFSSDPLRTVLQQSRVIVIFSAFIFSSSTLISWMLEGWEDTPVPRTHSPLAVWAFKTPSSSDGLLPVLVVRTLTASLPWPDKGFWVLKMQRENYWRLITVLFTWEVKVNSFKFLLFTIFKGFLQVIEDVFGTVDNYFLVLFEHLCQLFLIFCDTRKILQSSIVILQEEQDCQILDSYCLWFIQ